MYFQINKLKNEGVSKCNGSTLYFDTASFFYRNKPFESLSLTQREDNDTAYRHVDVLHDTAATWQAEPPAAAEDRRNSAGSGAAGNSPPPKSTKRSEIDLAGIGGFCGVAALAILIEGPDSSAAATAK